MRAAISSYWRSMASGRRYDLLSSLTLVLLTPPSLVYALIQGLRARLYRVGVFKVKQLPRPVLSIGNITVGGTGKTPVTAYIARLLIAQGLKVAVLSRGYGGTCEGRTAIVSDGNGICLSADECGDEPFLLARTVPGLMVVIGTDRHAAGILAMERLNPDVFLLDDGFQHLRLHRDLNILLLDYARPFGNGLCLPAGLLREQKSATSRADLIIHTRCPDGGTVVDALPDTPHICARHLIGNFISLVTGESLHFSCLHGKKVLAFAGIAEPDGFFEGLSEQGLDLVATINFPDHVVYGGAVFTVIEETLHRSGADFAVTTEKDGVKLNNLPQHITEKILLARLDFVIDDPAPLESLLRNLLQKQLQL